MFHASQSTRLPRRGGWIASVENGFSCEFVSVGTCEGPSTCSFWFFFPHTETSLLLRLHHSQSIQHSKTQILRFAQHLWGAKKTVTYLRPNGNDTCLPLYHTVFHGQGFHQLCRCEERRCPQDFEPCSEAALLANGAQRRFRPRKGRWNFVRRKLANRSNRKSLEEARIFQVRIGRLELDVTLFCQLLLGPFFFVSQVVGRFSNRRLVFKRCDLPFPHVKTRGKTKSPGASLKYILGWELHPLGQERAKSGLN